MLPNTKKWLTAELFSSLTSILPQPANPLKAWPGVCNGVTQVQCHRLMLQSPLVSHNAPHPSAA